MTETAYPVTTITGHDYTLPSLQHAAPSLDRHRHVAPVVDESLEDDGQISCLCGYLDDDGWTVQCDSCNRWQHQLCYYPDYEDRALPESLQHYCVECRPRPFDTERARVRQRVKREDQASEINGIKRQAAKNHKKKIKEPAYTNGWPLDKSRHDRNSASPRDQPPPAKRPKTSHRPSDFITTLAAKGHSRKRNTSNAANRRSLSRSPESPIELYSEHFMRCYLEDDWAGIDVNLYNSIPVSQALSEWLNVSDESFREEHGYEKGEVLNRWEGDLDDIPGKAQIQIETNQDQRVTDSEGNFPTWKWVTVQESVASGAYLGELKGHVGFKEEYQEDPANRWTLLRHPEPFVFFHPRLPIYIDARNEGTELRYIRRSCQPNAKLQILVTDSTTYRFCFMATRQIDPGMEVAVAWDTREGFARMEGGLESGDLDYLSSFVSTVLANHGPCACQLDDAECGMARFDRRSFAGPKSEDTPQPVKAPKSKKKKVGHQISPLNTHINSRSGSEVRRVDLDDEPSDSRSASGSAGHDSASRDMTPNTHYSHNGSLSAIPELSERERKKLAKEEEMFRKQEEGQMGKQGKKKRNSSGSNLNTPNASSSKQLGFPSSSRYTDASTSRQTGLPPSKPGRKPKGSGAQKSPATSSSKGVKRPKPDYVDSGVQCDLDAEEDAKRVPMSLPRKPFLSTTQRLLQRCALNNARRKGPAAVAEAEKRLKESDEMDVDQPANDGTASKSPPSNVDAFRQEMESVARPEAMNDSDMKDAPVDQEADAPMQVDSTDQQVQEAKTEPPPINDLSSSSLANSSAPPWPSQASHLVQEAPNITIHSHKPTDMHLQMPPPPANPFSSAPTSALSTGTPNSVTGFGAISQSPLGGPGSASLFSPSVTAAVTPSPAKKKLSLSDYTKRNKAKDKESEAKSDRGSSPAANAAVSTPAVPHLQASSSSSEDVVKDTAEKENTKTSDEDVKMEDAVETGVAG